MITPAVNKLLESLPSEERTRLIPELQDTDLGLGDVVYESGKRPAHVFFPTSCIVSFIYTMEDGAVAEMGLVGNDGVVGIAIFMGGETVPNRAVVQLAGRAIRMKAATLQKEFRRGGHLQKLLLRYVQALITQVSQTAVCNRLHSVEQRLSRRLLLCRDRVHSDEFIMTQELISKMLGGGRQSVTVAAGRLKEAGVIEYSRGYIRIIDRSKLESSACECYHVVKAESDRMFQ